MAQLTPEQLVRNALHRRAIEAVIWGMPAVNTDLMFQAMAREVKGGWNQIVYWSRLLDWKNQTLTPNPDAIYLMPFFDTAQAGPMVIEIPPADEGSITGSIMDCWQTPLEDVGPAGVDKGKGGKYLILPPGYSGTVPDELHRAPVADLSGVCAVAIDPPERQRRRFCQGGRLWQADRVLSALCRGEPAGHHLSRCRRRRLRRHDSLRCALLRIAGAHGREPALAGARPGDDRHAADARHREGQGVHSRR